MRPNPKKNLGSRCKAARRTQCLAATTVQVQRRLETSMQFRYRGTAAGNGQAHAEHIAWRGDFAHLLCLHFFFWPAVSVPKTLAGYRCSPMHKVVEKAVFEDVPAVVLQADDVDMKVWAVLCSDNTMRMIGKLHRERKYPVNRGLRLSRADKITDAGLKAVADSIGPHLLVCTVCNVTAFLLLGCLVSGPF